MSHHRSMKSNTGVPDALAAVALQDHWMRTMNIDLSTSKPRKKSLTAHLAYKRPVGKAIVDSNRKTTKDGKKVEAEREYVLDKQLPPPTLAQKMGLIEQPKSLLDEYEWAIVKEKAIERKDFSQPCVICKEDIGKMCHVILSCTHVFHKNCLQAFERFSGKKSCPMCRKEQYQTRVVHHGSAAYQHKCAAKIQAAWRGYVVRTWYKKLRETTPPKDPNLRKKFFEDKLHSITDRMVKSLDMGVNQLLHEVNQNLEASRLIFQQFEARQQEISLDEWMQIYKKAQSRMAAECPICLVTLTEGDRGGRALIVTSCTHIFHETCLSMFEALSDSNSLHCCPVCRSYYCKQLLPDD